MSDGASRVFRHLPTQYVGVFLFFAIVALSLAIHAMHGALTLGDKGRYVAAVIFLISTIYFGYFQLCLWGSEAVSIMVTNTSISGKPVLKSRVEIPWQNITEVASLPQRFAGPLQIEIRSAHNGQIRFNDVALLHKNELLDIIQQRAPQAKFHVVRNWRQRMWGKTTK